MAVGVYVDVGALVCVSSDHLVNWGSLGFSSTSRFHLSYKFPGIITQRYITKNSWDDDSNKQGGYLNMSEAYVRLNTVAIMIHKDAIPDEIQAKGLAPEEPASLTVEVEQFCS